MKKYLRDVLAITGIICVVLVFFYRTILYGLLPVPSDALVGLYHPWRDAYAHTFTNGVPFKNFLITDSVRQQIPWRKQVIDAFKSKKLPLWDATSFSGVPLLGNIQSGALYPLNILFFMFPFSTAWTILIMSQPLLAGIFLFLFLRHKKLDIISSLVGSVCFSFSGFSIAWLTWGTILSTLCWLPLLLLSFDMIHQSSRKTRWRLLFIFSLISAFFGGHLQIFLYSMLVLGSYALWNFRKVKMQQVYVMHVIIPLVVLVLTAPVWSRLLLYLPDTSRIAGSAWTVEGFFIPLKHLVQFVVPDFFGNPATLNYWGVWNYGEMVGYIGVIGILFAIVGISVQSGFWVGIIVVALLFAVDSPLSRLPFSFHIPILSSLQPTRLLSVVDFGLSILAAYGMSTLVKGDKKKQLFIAGLALLLLFAGTWISMLMPALFGIPTENIAVVKRNLILPSIISAAGIGFLSMFLLCRKSWSTIRYVLGIVMLVVLSSELIRFGWKFTPFTNAAFFFPKTEIISRLEQLPKPFRVIAVDDRLLPPNTLSFYGIESLSGYDPIHSVRYEEYIAAMERGEANIKPPFGFNRIITPKTLTSPLLPLLNVQYVISMDPLTGKNVRLLIEEGTTKLYKFVNGVPRVYLADEIWVSTSKESVIENMYSKTFKPGRTAVVESAVSIISAPLGLEEIATILEYEGDRMTIETTTKSPRLLVIGNMMDTHWRVTVDGKKTDVVRVNYLFFGVVVPDGTHTIAVQYK